MSEEYFEQFPSPCYIMFEEALEANLQLLDLVQREADVSIICALKGFSFWHSFPLIKHYLQGAAASSVNEARLIVEEMGCEAHTYSPVYTDEEFEHYLVYSKFLTFNSLHQWSRFRDRVLAFPRKKIRCGLRVNPEFSAVKTALYNPALPGSRLGILAEQMPKQLPEGIDGLHFHVLCENDSYALEKCLSVFEAKFSHLIKECKWVNFGGGHLITAENYDIPHLIELLKGFRKRYPNIEELILEPGGAVGWQTGVLVSTVEDVIENQGVLTALLNVSFACHMPDCLEMPYKPAIIGATDPDENSKFIYRMGGNSCLAGDFMGMGDYAFPLPLEIGDRIVFDDMIHYTMVKTTFFNGVKHPAIGIVYKDGSFELLRQPDYQAYKDKLG
ncbi:MAG TPA: carboxynorspermidine decarboxylase [Bacteroidales bacterium]|jgi:carboxynorspermidine decarboxylase|nr:carboxynorspermidine decarboxylase [Bacteroidales bacterium]HOS57697.1 carboxynorspermidine decarboxylase [Bacteroidales bacterium]HRR04255.1 carboxynorspermidine decarboxylase [Bacteroidales bacterium]HRT14247.1 carboxynorspermidine decarboxylase [Bacteroidales bacterium]